MQDRPVVVRESGNSVAMFGIVAIVVIAGRRRVIRVAALERVVVADDDERHHATRGRTERRLGQQRNRRHERRVGCGRYVVRKLLGRRLGTLTRRRGPAGFPCRAPAYEPVS